MKSAKRLKNPDKKLFKAYLQMNEMALDYVKQLVADKFKQNKNLGYFIIAMGTYFFCDLDGEVLYDHEVNCKRIDDFISEWDSILKLTGEGLKILRDGTIITDF